MFWFAKLKGDFKWEKIMKNIAIITFSDFNTNYGSMLQALSLKIYLEGLGHKVVFIKYREFNEPIKEKSIKKRMYSYGRNIVFKGYRFWKKKDIKETEENFQKFKEQFFEYTELFTSSEEIRDKLKEFDWYICGSDQIWNIDCLGGLRTSYFLDFAPDNKVKMAYAASMGDYKLDTQYKKQFIALLNRLDYISVRERTSTLQLQTLVSKKIENVVDPVFLTKKEVWERLIPETDIKEKYAICYFVRRSAIGRQIVKTLQSKLNLKIFNMSDNLIYPPKTSSRYISSDPLKFLSLIRNAEFTVGTSFHLVAFSIIFNKPVLVIGTEHNEQRVKNLLKMVDAEENCISEEILYSNTLLEKCLNVEYNYEKLNSYIEESEEFIRLGEEWNE